MRVGGRGASAALVDINAGVRRQVFPVEVTHDREPCATPDGIIPFELLLRSTFSCCVFARTVTQQVLKFVEDARVQLRRNVVPDIR